MTYNRFPPFGEFFLKQGRPDFLLKGCVILCVITYKVKLSGGKLRNTILRGSFPKLWSVSHAEELALDEIIKTEQKNNWKAIKIELYSSYSPCRKCCKLIEEFLHRRPGCKMSIAFTCVFRHTDERNQSALRELYNHRSVTGLDVFRKKEWGVLQDVNLLALTLGQAREMRKWDFFWRRKLEDILDSDTVDWAENDEDLSTDAVPNCQTTNNEDEEDYLPSQAEFEDMEKKVQKAIRRRSQKDLFQLIVSVALISTLLYFLWFLISRFIF